MSPRGRACILDHPTTIPQRCPGQPHHNHPLSSGPRLSSKKKQTAQQKTFENGWHREKRSRLPFGAYSITGLFFNGRIFLRISESDRTLRNSRMDQNCLQPWCQVFHEDKQKKVNWRRQETFIAIDVLDLCVGACSAFSCETLQKHVFQCNIPDSQCMVYLPAFTHKKTT